MTREVRDIALEILDRVSVRGMDAIHLASARWAKRNLKAEVRFWCADQRLSEAATEIGLQVQNPEATEV